MNFGNGTIIQKRRELPASESLSALSKLFIDNKEYKQKNRVPLQCSVKEYPHSFSLIFDY
jgi:hypothetical protein